MRRVTEIIIQERFHETLSAFIDLLPCYRNAYYLTHTYTQKQQGGGGCNFSLIHTLEVLIFTRL